MTLGTCGHVLDQASVLVGDERCSDCERNRLVSIGRRLAAEGMKRAAEAKPGEKDRVVELIARLASTGQRFSANDIREQHGISGPVVGAAFGAASKARLIRRVDMTPSTDPNTHGHHIGVWVGNTH